MVNSDLDVNTLVEIILELPFNSRNELLDLLKSHICMDCGGDDPRCQCENDE